MLHEITEKYPQQVKLVVKHFPLPNHRWARQAAEAALAAGQQGKFWELHKLLFENYRVLDDKKIEDLARGLGLDMEKLNSDMKSPAIQELINRDIQNARDVGVRGTPTLYVNGKLLTNRSREGFEEMIDAELKKKP